MRRGENGRLFDIFQLDTETSAKHQQTDAGQEVVIRLGNSLQKLSSKKQGIDGRGSDAAANGTGGRAEKDGIWKDDNCAASTVNILKLVQMQQFRCALTGMVLTPATATIDHIVPIKDGGKNDMRNFQVIDARLNAMKGTLSQQEFIDLCCMVARHSGQQNVSR